MDIDKNKLKPISEKYEASVIKDENGNTILSLGVKTTESVGEDGEIVTEKYMENIVLDNGRVWNSSLAIRPGKDAIFVSKCPTCKTKKNELNLTLSDEMRRCYRCGRFVCSKCIKVSSDNHLRCSWCNVMYKIFVFIRWIFFEKEK